MPPGIEVVRVYEDPGRRRGDHRALADRLWPRGITKERLDHDEWLVELAPSPALRRWYAHDATKFAEFSRRYRAELRAPGNAEALARLRGIAQQRRLVLLTATRDAERSSANVLRGVLEKP